MTFEGIKIYFLKPENTLYGDVDNVTPVPGIKPTGKKGNTLVMGWVRNYLIWIKITRSFTFDIFKENLKHGKIFDNSNGRSRKVRTLNAHVQIYLPSNCL